MSVHVNPDNLFIKKFTMTPVNIFIKANAYYFTGIQGILVFNPSGLIWSSQLGI